MSNDTSNLIPPGTYRAKAVEAQLGETSGGAEQVAISFAVLTPGFEQHHLAYYGTFGEKALPITVKALRACGWQGLDLSDLSGIDANEVSLVVEHEEYQGVTRARVKWVNEGGGALLKKQLDPQAARTFAQRMRGAIAAVDTGTPKRPAAAPAQRTNGRPPEPPPHTDADMPF